MTLHVSPRTSLLARTRITHSSTCDGRHCRSLVQELISKNKAFSEADCFVADNDSTPMMQVVVAVFHAGGAVA